MTKPWTYRQTQDKLRIFVSSRLQECKAERAIAQDAINSINHQPILFEHLGARPYLARDLYLSRLRDSQAMIAIYRSGYGYVDTANSMTISGLEEEYRFATKQGIPTLNYVQRPSGDRDSRLAAMINEIESTSTLSFYTEPPELADRIRDDLTALITGRYLGGDLQQQVLRETSTDILARTQVRTGTLLVREGLVRELAIRSGTSSMVCVYGPAGIGKTTLVAQFAERTGAAFVRVAGLSPKELFAACAAWPAPGLVDTRLS